MGGVLQAHLKRSSAQGEELLRRAWWALLGIMLFSLLPLNYTSVTFADRSVSLTLSDGMRCKFEQPLDV